MYNSKAKGQTEASVIFIGDNKLEITKSAALLGVVLPMRFGGQISWLKWYARCRRVIKLTGVKRGME